MTLNEHISWRQNLREYVPNSLNRVKKNTEPPVSTISCRTCLIQASIENFINNQSMWPVIAYVQRWLKVSKFPTPPLLLYPYFKVVGSLSVCMYVCVQIPS